MSLFYIKVQLLIVLTELPYVAGQGSKGARQGEIKLYDFHKKVPEKT
jgi:hypothetical protein